MRDVAQEKRRILWQFSIKEYLEELQKELEVKIFATDIDQNAIEFASKGCYSINSVVEVYDDRLNKYFDKDGKDFRLLPTVRKMVIFAPHDLIKDPPFSKMDLVSCRNLLIYLNPDRQKIILKKFHFSLNTSGFLFLGSSESNRTLEDVTKEVDRKWKIYQKISSFPSASNNYLYLGKPVFKEPLRVLKTTDSVGASANNLTDLLNDTILEVSGYCAMFINEKHELIQASGNFKEYLTLPDKYFNPNIMKMMHEELAIATSALLRKCNKDAGMINTSGVHVKVGEEIKIVDLLGEAVKPDKKKSDKIILPLFNSRSSQTFSIESNHSHTLTTSLDHVHHLEAESLETKENLQIAIEELETANEEMQLSNEELVSANEELQSTNEELQSLNEELHTVNAEHQQKIKELIELNDDLNNYFKSTDIGQVFLMTIRY